MSNAALYLHPKYTVGAKSIACRNGQPTLDIMVDDFQVCIFADEKDRERIAKIAELLNELFEYNPPITEAFPAMSQPCPVDADGYDLPF